MIKKYILQRGLVGPFLLLLFILIGEACLTGVLPATRGMFFDGLTDKSTMIYVLLGCYYGNYLLLDLFQSVKEWSMTKVTLWWRYKRTAGILTDPKGVSDTRPQRVQQGIYDSYQYRGRVWIEYFVSGIIIVFLVVWNIDQPILVGASLVYACISVFIALKFNPRLTKAESIRLQAEASYREHLSATKTNLFDIGVLNYVNSKVRRLVRTRMEYSLFTKAQNGIMNVLPYIVLVPLLFDGSMTLGDVVKHQAAFALIVINASILISMYPVLIKGLAQEKRVKEME